MGQKRSYDYDAVIGVGGVEAEEHGFGGKLVWIGIGRDKTRVAEKAGPEVTFDHFLCFGTKGRKIPSKLAARIRRAPRGFMDLTSAEQAEAENLLELAKKALPSPARAKHGAAYDQVGGEDACSRSPRNQQRPRKRCP